MNARIRTPFVVRPLLAAVASGLRLMSIASQARAATAYNKIRSPEVWYTPMKGIRLRYKAEKEVWAPRHSIIQKHRMTNMYRRLAVALLTSTTFMYVGCSASGPIFTQSVLPYPKLALTTTVRPWIIIKCRFPDSGTIPNGLDARIGLLLTPDLTGFGSVPDYYSDVSYGAVSFAGTVVHPSVTSWYTAPFSLAGQPAFDTKYGKAARYERIVQCANATPANVDFSKFYGVIVVFNHIVDAGATAIGQIQMQIHGKIMNLAAVELDPSCLDVACSGHEVGHGLGLQHSYDTAQEYCGSDPGVYCDPWDIMSALSVFAFVDPNFPASLGPSSGPGLNVPNLLNEGWIPQERIATYTAGAPSTRLTLAALSDPTCTSLKPCSYPLTAELFHKGTPAFYTIEYRQQDGWDKAIPNNAVVIHSYVPGGTPYSILQGKNPPGLGWGCFNYPTYCESLSGQTWVDPLRQFTVTVNSIDPSMGTATVTIGGP